MLARVLMVLVASMVAAGLAGATTDADSITDEHYSAHQAGVVGEHIVTWRNDGQNPHSVTQNTGGKQLGLFDSGPLANGETFTYEFDYVGHYGYHDTFTGWRSYADFIPNAERAGRSITWILGAKPPPGGYVFDIEQKLKGTHTWDLVVEGTTETEVDVTYEPGTYIVRARLRRTADNRASGWSHKITLRIS